MTSLYDLERQASIFDHLYTGIPSIDELFKQGLGLYDFQTIPNCMVLYHIINSIIVSHLQHSKDTDVYIISMSNDYRFEILGQCTGFKKEWCKRIKFYRIYSVAKLIILLRNLKTIRLGSIVILDNFHFLLDLYKLQLSSTYQQVMLRNYCNNLKTIKEQHDRQEIQGRYPEITRIPSGSDLITESPSTKFNNHMAYIVNQLSQICISNSLLVFLTGKLDSKFQYNLNLTDSQLSHSVSSPASSQSDTKRPSFQDKFANSKLVLTLSNASKISPFKNNPLDATATKRIIFYRDWYSKVSRDFDKDEFIYCCKVDNGITYFTYKNEVLKVVPSVNELRQSEPNTQPLAANTLILVPSSPTII